MTACRRTCLAALAVVGSLLCVASASADIGRANLDGSGVEPHFITEAGGVGMAVDGEHMYWADVLAHTIARANLDGSDVDRSFITVPLIGPGLLSGPGSVAVGAEHIYWGSSEGSPPNGMMSHIGRVNLDGSGVEPHFITDAGGVGMAVDQAHIYWTNAQSGIGRANLDGSDVEPDFVTTGASAIAGIAVDTGHIYWTDACHTDPASCRSGAIGRANLDGSGVEPSFITGVAVPHALAVDSGHIYWIRTDPSSVWPLTPDTIGRANLDGSGVQRAFITVDEANLNDLAVDAAHIYWTSSTRASLLALQVAPRTFMLTGRLVKGRCTPTTHANRAKRRCTRPIKLRISYRLSTATRVSFVFERRTGGRLVNGRCVATTRGNRANRTCTRLVFEGGFLRYGRAGANSFTFDGVIRSHTLAAGSFRLIAIPGGNGKTVNFKITR